MDIPAILTYFGIPYTESHPNLGSKAIGVDCPACGDTQCHCGVFLGSGRWYCFKCEHKGNLFKLVRHYRPEIDFEVFKSYLKVSQGSGIDPVKQIQNIFWPEGETVAEEKKLETIEFPPPGACSSDKVPRPAQHLIDTFCRQRNFTLEELKQYDTHFGVAGDYKGRLIFPIITQERYVGLTARALVPASRKYLFPPGFSAHDIVYDTNEFLLSGVPANRIPVICEGVLDAWAIAQVGFRGIALFGKETHDRQVIHLTKILTPHCGLLVAMDGEAMKYTVKCRQKLDSYFNARSVYLPFDEDPCSMGRSSLYQLLARSSNGPTTENGIARN